jgi:predicted acylesterase/phospholipase RssA
MGKNNIPNVQRALVFQGGGSIGAYEAGVFKAFYDSFFKVDEPFFDILAGVSIGAVNASILVSHVKNNRERWKGSFDTLRSFWNEISTPPANHNNQNNGGPVSTTSYIAPFIWKPLMSWLDSSVFKQSWDFGSIGRDNWNAYWKSFSDYLDKTFQNMGEGKQKLPTPLYFFKPDNLGPLADGEDARRYYMWKSFLAFGTPNVLSQGIVQWDAKFLDFFNPSATLLRFDNSPLANVIEKYWRPLSSIATSREDHEPRLLFVSTDLESGSTVTFDSYEKKDERGGKTRRTIFGEDKAKYIIDYPDGIEMKHLMTSMSSHLKYEYPSLIARAEGNGQKLVRHFWDGVYLSNTPLRELLQSYHDYWGGTEGIQEGIPKLQVYIVNLYPTFEKRVPIAPDEILDRQYNILFNDRTRYDEKVAHLVSDYIDFGNRMRDLALQSIKAVQENNSDNKNLGGKHNAAAILEQEFEEILNLPARSSSRDGRGRQYRDLLDGRFDVKIYRIEREADEKYDIYGKAFDFSAATIANLLQQGEQDALRHIEEGSMAW